MSHPAPARFRMSVSPKAINSFKWIAAHLSTTPSSETSIETSPLAGSVKKTTIFCFQPTTVT
jgi:hypothetical protein